MRLSRSKKTGKSKHYAFLEFGSAEVARIVAEAMDGYMLFAQKLVARHMRKEEVHEELFKGANRVFKQVGHASRTSRFGTWFGMWLAWRAAHSVHSVWGCLRRR